MADSTIALRVQQMGAEGVRNRLREINNELRAGAPVTKNLKKEVSDLTDSQSQQLRISNLLTRSFAAQHPQLMTLGRVMSTVGSVARSVLAVTTALSVASLAFGKSNSQLVEAETALARANRELVAAMESGDPERIAEAQENINVITAQIKELKEQDIAGMATNFLNLGASVALMGSQSLAMVRTLGPLTAGLLGTKVTMTALSPALSVATVSTRTFGGAIRGLYAALGPIGWIMLGLSIAIPLLIQYWPEITAAFQGFADFMVKTFGPAFSAAWSAILAGAKMFWNGLITFTNAAINSLLRGIEVLANGFIATVNGMISAYNSVASLLGLGKIGKLGAITLPMVNIPLVAAANGFDGMVNQPTMFLAGERGPEHVRVTPSGRSGGGGSGGNVIIHIHGDVTGEEVINKVRDAMKERMQSLGWTGY